MNPSQAQNRSSPPYKVNGLFGPTAEQGGASPCPPCPIVASPRIQKDQNGLSGLSGLAHGGGPKPGEKLQEGRFYTARNGITGRACRHPLHECGMVGYLEKPTGEIIGVFPDTVRRASPSEIQSWRMEFDALEEYEP